MIRLRVIYFGLEKTRAKMSSKDHHGLPFRFLVRVTLSCHNPLFKSMSFQKHNWRLMESSAAERNRQKSARDPVESRPK